MNKPLPFPFLSSIQNLSARRGALFGGILMIALLAFEVFNYSTTDFALTDVLGANLRFIGIRWSTILSIAFCAIDFAGIARLFTPQKDARDEPAEVWYLFGAWILAAAMNAVLTWWGVAVAISSHTSQGSQLVGRELVSQVVPVFVAVMVWLIRLLIIGTFSMAGDRLFSSDDARVSRQASYRYEDARARAAQQQQPQTARPGTAAMPRPMPKPEPSQANRIRPSEPSYHPVGMAAKKREEEQVTWR